MRESAHPPSAKIWTAGILAILNGVFWLQLAVTTEPLPLSEFADRRPSVSVTESEGMQFDMCHDCGPIFVLAGRDVGLGWWEKAPMRRTIQLSNLPGRIVAAIAAAMVEGTLGSYGSMWVGTVAFTLASTCQWWGIGWAVGGLGIRLGRTIRAGQHS